ncbi:MAG: alpha/beta hydrolase [Naasia sp.]
MPTPAAPPSDTARPVLFCLHALGSSAREFDVLTSLLGDTVEVVGLDLPGFGDLSSATGTSVDAMAAHVVRKIRAHGATRWMLLGHSMGGKVASVVAARTLSGEAPVFGLAGVVLLAASPPTPEPMEDERRAEMLSWVDDGPLDEAAAREFVDANTGGSLDARSDRRAITDLTRTAPDAWRAWLQRGSNEDWSAEVGALDLPALIISGGADGDLGTEAQHVLNGRVYPRAEFLALEGAGHLLPLERPTEIADAIRLFWTETAALAPALGDDWARLLGSPRVSARTRGILAERMIADPVAGTPKMLTSAQLAVLRAVADRVVPQQGIPIDLARRLDAQLARGTGDGWRNAELPSDPEAYRAALDGLAGFDDLDADRQDDHLAAIAAGGTPLGTLSPAAAEAWFEDLRADLVRIWLAHPASMARIGFDGFANGTAGRALTGYDLLAAGERETWEPTPTETM